MLPDLPVLLAILLGLLYIGEGPVDPVPALLGTLASVLVGVGMTWMAGERGIRGIRASETRVAVSAARWIGIWPLLAWASAIYLFQWGSLVADVMPRTTWVLRYVVLFVPAATLFAVSWVQRARIEAAAASARGVVIPSGGAAEAIREGIKRNGIALVPMFLILALLEGLWVLGEWGVPGLATFSRWVEALEFLALAVTMTVLIGITMFLPALLRRVLSTEPLAPGPTRDLLERQAAAIDLRYRDILVWKTKGRSLNAMVVGFTPRTRHIFITDALLRHLPTEEVLAVFSHEAGHAKRYHLPLFLVLFVAAALLFQVLGGVLQNWGISPEWIIAGHLAFLWFVLLGSVSRVFEREADLYGADHATDLSNGGEAMFVPGLEAPLPAGAAYMIRALERIRMLSGRGSSHRHGTIQQRAEFLAQQATRPPVREAFLHRVKRLHLAIGGAVVLALLATAWYLPRDIQMGRARLAFADAGEAYEAAVKERNADREDLAIPHWEAAYAGFERAVDELADRTDPPAVHWALLSRFNAADSVFHGLEDEALGARLFQEMLDYAKTAGLDPAATRSLRFQAHVDLGRALAHLGDPAALDAWPKARASMPQGGGSRDEAYYRARLQLLRAVLLARVEAALLVLRAADPTGAVTTPLLTEWRGKPRHWLDALAAREEEGDRWDELRRDAKRELALLPPGL